MNMSPDTIVSTILDRTNNMNIEDLKAINDAVKTRWNSIQYHTAQNFKRGDNVKFFVRKTGRNVLGKVTKVNAKTVQVMSTDNVSWKVAPQLLEQA